MGGCKALGIWWKWVVTVILDEKIEVSKQMRLLLVL